MDETAAWYSRVAGQVQGLYRDWATGVAADAEALALIASLPHAKQQPQLVFAVSRLLGAPEGPFPLWRDWLLANWPALARETAERMTQTNEPARCAVLLPALAQLPGPIALLEVGASAGLCLYPDRYSYRYRDDSGVVTSLDPADGVSSVLLECRVTDNVPLPTELPEIVWRAGIDVAPLSVSVEADLAWLDVSVPPEAHERRMRARAAASIAQTDPPRLVAGDATETTLSDGPRTPLAALAAEAPAGATLVILTTGVLVYLPRAQRVAFAAEVAALGAHWLSFEAAGMVELSEPRASDHEDGDDKADDDEADDDEARDDKARDDEASDDTATKGSQSRGGKAPDSATAPTPGAFLLGLDGILLAEAAPHGESLTWR